MTRSPIRSMLQCGRPQQCPHERPHPWSGRRHAVFSSFSSTDRQSSQGRRSRGVRGVGRRALTAREDSGGHNGCGRPVRAGLDAPRPLPLPCQSPREESGRFGGAASHRGASVCINLRTLGREVLGVFDGAHSSGRPAVSECQSALAPPVRGSSQRLQELASDQLSSVRV